MKQIVHAVLKKAGFELKHIPSQPSKPEQTYIDGGRVPWSREYDQAKREFIGKVLANPDVLEVFRKGEPLPEKFGVAFDERCVEYPWLFAHTAPDAERYLDAGSALNHQFILEQPVLQDKKMHILTLAPESKCFWRKGISYFYEDLRRIPIQNNFYDTVVCISTLEHVGMDNSRATHSDRYREQRPDDFTLAIREMKRTLKPEGRLFITVPFGRYSNQIAFQQFDSGLLDEMINAFDGDLIKRSFFKYLSTGWQRATEMECQDCQYVEWVAQRWANPDQGWPYPLPVEPDRAAAARAVACLILAKSV